MATAIGSAIMYAFGASAATVGTSVAVGGVVIGTYASIIGSAVLIGASAVYSSSQNAKLRRSLSTAAIDNGRSVMVRDPVSPRRLIYGKARVSGTIVFMHTTGAKNEYLHLVIVLAGHEVQAITDIYLNDELVELSGADATGKYAGYVRVNKHLGTSTQTADSDLVSEIPSLWTSNHRLRGCAYISVRLKGSPDIFPHGLPTISAVVMGKKVYDPRTTTTVYSDNSALCSNDFLTDTTFGKKVPYARVKEDDLIEAANICDETVIIATSLSRSCDVASGNRHIGCSNMADVLPGYKVTGTGIPSDSTIVSVASDFFTIDRDPTASNTGTTLTIGDGEKRYTCNGIATADQDRNDVLRDLVGSMVGYAVDTGGLWTIRAGAWRTPTMTLTDDDLRGGITVVPRQSRQDTFNGVKGVYISPANKWAPADFPVVKNDTYKTQDGNIRLWYDVQYNYTISSATAQRISKVELERGRQQITFNGLYAMKAMRLMPGDVVGITRSRLGWSAKYFEVINFTFQQTGNPNQPGLAVSLDVRETAEGVWDWNDGEETAIDLAPNTDLPDPFTVPTPSGTYLSDSTTVIIHDNTVLPRIKVSWLTPDDIHVEEGGFVEIQFKRAADSTWLSWSSTITGNLLEDYISADLKVGIAYNVRVRFRNNAGVRGDWDTSGSITAVGDNTTPNAPTNLSATAKPGYNLIDWDPSASVTVNEYFIYRSTTGAGSGFSLLAQTAASQYNDGAVTPGTEYWYKVVGQSIAGYPSSELGPSSGVVALASTAASIPDDPTAPVDQSVSGVYLSGDGTVMSYRTVRLAALPTNAVWQNLLYRRDGASEWMVAGQYENTSNTDVRLDDLTPGVTYNIAVQAWSGAGASNVVAGSNISAPNKSAIPNPPTGGSVGQDGTPFTASGISVRFGSRVSWTPPADKDISHFEVKATFFNSDGDTVYSWDDGTTAPGIIKVPYGKNHLTLYNSTGSSGFARVRCIDRTGNASAWLYCGNCSSAMAQAVKGMALQNPDDVEVSGITIGNSFVNKVLIRQPYIGGHSIAGGGITDTLNLNISGFGFSVAPDVGNFQVANATAVARYDWDDSTSTNAVFRIRSLDGAGLPSFIIINGEFIDYQ